MFFAQLAAAVGFSLIFPFFPLYVEELGSSTGLSVELLAGLVVSAQAFTMMITAPVWGALADRYGRKLMVQRAAFGGAGIIALMGFVTSAEQLVLLRAVQGLVTGTVSAANALVAANTPREHTGFAMGTIQMGLWSGVAVGPLLGGILSDTFGYPITFVLTGVLLAVSGITVTLGVHETFTPSSTSQSHRGGMVRSMVGEWRHVVLTPGVGTTFLARFLNGLSRSMLVPITPLFVASLVVSGEGVNTVTGLVVGSASAAATFSAVYLGRLGDRIGHRKIFVASALAAGLFFVPHAIVADAWQLLVLHMLTGAAGGGAVASLSALLARYTAPGEEGAVYGLDNSIEASARTVAPLIGATVAVWFGLRGAFVAAGMLLFATAFLAARLLPKPAARRAGVQAPPRKADARAKPAISEIEAKSHGK